MLFKGTSIIENIDEGNLSRELEIAKFRNYSRENFAELIHFNISFEEFIENSSKFYSINLPNELSEYFVRADLSTYFPLSEAPIFNQIEEILLNKKNKFEFIPNYREVKNYFYKWISQKPHRDKQFYANSIVNSVERNFNFQNFFNVLLYAIVVANEKSVYNPKKAIFLLDRVNEIVSGLTLPFEVHNQVLYITQIYKGFVYLKEYEYVHAYEAFSDALNYNEHGITAFFYCALSARYLEDFDKSYDYLKEILEFDQARFKYAINYNFLSLFNFFYKNAVFYNVFTDDGFAQLLPDIDFLIRSHFSSEKNSMEFTYSKLINLDNLRLKDFFNNSVSKEIQFLKDALDHYQQKRTGLIRIVEQIFRDKLITLIEYIRSLIETHYYDQIKEEIHVFDKQIEQNKRQLERIKLEMEDASNKIKINLEEAAEYLEEYITEQSKSLEEKIENIDRDPKYNPSQVFYNSVLFTIFVAFLVFFVVGVITSIAGYGEEIASGQLALKVGMKWGGITFSVGVFISIFTTMSTFWEKSAERKELHSQLEKVKDQEAEERELIKEDSERKKMVYEQKFKERLKSQEKIIENFIIEREHNYDQKYKRAKKELDLYVQPLNELLSSIENNG